MNGSDNEKKPGHDGEQRGPASADRRATPVEGDAKPGSADGSAKATPINGDADAASAVGGAKMGSADGSAKATPVNGDADAAPAGGGANSDRARSDSSQALDDIEFIKQLIARNNRRLNQAHPYLYIWGLYLTIGCIGMQFDSTVWPIWYWSCAALVGGALSAFASMRQFRNARPTAGGSYGWMFWLPFLVTMAAGCFMMAADIVRNEDLLFFWFILLGLCYVSLGALAGKGPVALGSWFIVLAAITKLFLVDYQYMIMGILGGGSTIVAGLLLQRRMKSDG